MKRLLILLLLVSGPVLAEDIVSVSGVEHKQAELLELEGLSTQGISPTNKARIYFNATDDRTKLSENGGAYYNILTGTVASNNYLEIDGANANTEIDIGSENLTTAGTLTTGSLLIGGTAPDDLYVNIIGDTMTGQLQATTLTDGTLIITNGDLTTIGDVSCKDVIVSGNVDGIDVAGMSAFVVLNSAHRNDNTQAHTDYMLNVGDITTGDYNFTAGNLTTTGTGIVGSLRIGSTVAPTVALDVTGTTVTDNLHISGSAGVGTTTPVASAALDVTSTTKGFLPPRMTTGQRDAIASPASGLMVYNTDINDVNYYNGSNWSRIGETAWSCGSSKVITHIAGDVCPVTKTVTYGTVTSALSGASKCWITQNLGADQQASVVDDSTEASAGWYWQFNLKQGYKHDGSVLTPSWTVTSINEESDWTSANDPCAILLGTGWRLPTYTEWLNADANGETGGWDDYNETFADALKLHAAGYLNNGYGALGNRGSIGYYWSSTQYSAASGWYLAFYDLYSGMFHNNKANGFGVRCLKD